MTKIKWKDMETKYPKAIDKLVKDKDFKIKKNGTDFEPEPGWQDRDIHKFFVKNNMTLLIEETMDGKWIHRIYKDGERFQTLEDLATYDEGLEKGFDKALEKMEEDL